VLAALLCVWLIRQDVIRRLAVSAAAGTQQPG